MTKRITVKFDATSDELESLKLLALQIGFDSISDYMLHAIREYAITHANKIAEVRRTVDAAATTDTRADTQGDTTPTGNP